jgi:hypothetical protein
MNDRRRKHRQSSGIDRAWILLLLSLRAFGRRKALAIVVFGLLGLAGSTAIGVTTGGPLPAIHDEFAYLLAADTYASGRLTNPRHRHWEHFETFHVLVQPTYSSKYPPGQGLVLALGQMLGGTPAAGVWLSAGLVAAATAWMLLMWLPPRWAVLAAAFCTVQLSWLLYWSHSFWGGAVAASGGALALGAFRKLEQRPFALGTTLGAGLGILAISRPFEGAITGICIAVALVGQFVSASGRQRVQQLRALVPAICIIALTFAWLGYYNWRITGSVLASPYQVYQRQYSSNPLLLLGTPGKTPTYRHPELERFFKGWGVQRYEQHRSSILQGAPKKIGMMTIGLLGVGVLGLIGLPGVVRRRSLRFVFVTLSAVIGAVLLTSASYPHYVAPVASLFYVVLGTSLAHLHQKARLSGSTNLAIIVTLMLVILAPVLLARVRASPYKFAFDRDHVVRELESRPEKSLVFVKYSETHNQLEEWVYNRADIDGAKVAWARFMSPAQNHELIEYFSDRKAWLIEPDVQIRIIPYPP